MTSTPAPDGRASLGDGLRFAFGTLTVLPVRVARWDRTAARAGMAAAPLAGLVVGGGAAAAGALLVLAGASAPLAAVAAVAVPAVLTRGLHLDGLADTADGLGSARPAGEALAIMKRSDIGPFGVITLLLTLLAQVAAVSSLYGAGAARGAAGVVVAGVTARLALTLACRTGVPAARPEGLGAMVAGTVPAPVAWGVAVVVVGAGAAAGGVSGAAGAVHHALAVAAGAVAARLLLAHCVRRFGGVTGDVFGAVAETAGTATLVALALGR
ncbi:adenosylcobinamide-GDP ribazoletransferase [Streptomyces sp. NPDC093085]|uniref:adenosylcobinamide-GDP ribazoletransferase n=1 Tax=Streptomyces sp. NPDC093085 TaxID=3155068 RepID=UPI00342750ED